MGNPHKPKRLQRQSGKGMSFWTKGKGVAGWSFRGKEGNSQEEWKE